MERRTVGRDDTFTPKGTIRGIGFSQGVTSDITSTMLHKASLCTSMRARFSYDEVPGKGVDAALRVRSTRADATADARI